MLTIPATGLIFAGKARSLPIEWSPARGSTWVGSSFARKYSTMVEMSVSDITLAYNTAAFITSVKRCIVHAHIGVNNVTIFVTNARH